MINLLHAVRAHLTFRVSVKKDRLDVSLSSEEGFFEAKVRQKKFLPNDVQSTPLATKARLRFPEKKLPEIFPDPHGTEEHLDG